MASGFWEGAAVGELLLQRCFGCGHLRFPPSQVCPRCLSEEAEWVKSTGAGEVLTYVVFHHAYNPKWADRLPYNVVLVQLDDGPRMFSNFVGPRELLAVGTRVKAIFTKTEERDALPQFEPVS